MSHILNQTDAAKLAQRFEGEEHKQGNGNNRPDVVNPVREEMVHVERWSSERHLEEQYIGITAGGIKNAIKNGHDQQSHGAFGQRDKP